jgi:putative oxidoreductase
MWNRLLRTDGDYGPTIARVALAIVILPHGAQKLLGWFGGGGVSGTIGFFESAWGIPAVLALLVIAAESFGALALLMGFVGRFAAVGIAAVMAGAVALQHASVGFFMNWTGAQAGEGFEFHLLALGLAAVVAVKGSGALSIDRLLTAQRSRTGTENQSREERQLVAA